jgi:fructose-specific phosphotransferase system IIC component
MRKNDMPVTQIIFLFVTLLSLVVSPAISPTLGTIALLLSLAFSTYAIYTKHAGTEHARVKILKEVGVMVLTLVIVLFLGGIASMLANAQVGMRWGTVAGLVSAIGASFAACPEPVEGVGYLVRVGMGRSTP